MFQSELDYVCDYCNRSFTRKYNLQCHIENTHINSSCYCEICEQKFGSPAGLQLHLQRGHNRNGQPYPECDMCGRIFTRKQNVVSHMITVHLQGSGPEIKCFRCNRTFTTMRNLKRHKALLHNPDINYPTCDTCFRVFKAKSALISHIQSVHNTSIEKKVKCHLCDKIYTNNRNLRRHLEMLHGGKEEFRCDICPKAYTSNQSLRRHVKSQHCCDDLYTYSCEHCNTSVQGRNNLEMHIHSFHRTDSNSLDNSDVTSLKTLEFPCTSCPKAFEEEPQLRQHVKSDHSFEAFYNYCRKSLLRQANYGKDIFQCEFCSTNFANVYDFKHHLKFTHEREYSLSTCNVCFNKFYTKEAISEHRKTCLPPDNVNACSYCNKLFTDMSSLEFHTRIFHPQAKLADNDITSTNAEDPDFNFKCTHCNRIYYSDRSLKHHMKLKHTTDLAVDCEYCGKVCNNKYYLASHIKIVHTNVTWSKCDFCEKQFKSKRNIRRHIEYTHLGMQRYKCVECETLFKEKRSLRKHLRTKHPNSVAFPECHICHKRFESAKSCKIHLKLLHSVNMKTNPCHLCSMSFSSHEALSIHLQTNHLAKDAIYKCEECNLVFKGQEKFDQHNDLHHVNLFVKQKVLPRCILCTKDFSTRKTLKRHIKKFHSEFNVDELATFGSRRRNFSVDCDECMKLFNDESVFNNYQKLKHLRDTVLFKCEECSTSYTTLEYAIQRHKMASVDTSKSKMIMSELCTTEMSGDEATVANYEYLHEMEPVSTTNDMIKTEMIDLDEIKVEAVTP